MEKNLLFLLCLHSYLFSLLRWNKAIFLIIKVKVKADLAGRSYRYVTRSSIPALLQPKQNYFLSLGTLLCLKRNRGY